MSVVHVQSITGITSITTPVGSDVLTFHSTNTTERVRITSGGKVGINQAAPLSDFDITATTEDSTDSLANHGIRLATIGAGDEEVIPISACFIAAQNRSRAAIGFISKKAGISTGYAGDIGFYTRSSADGHGLYRTDERLRITSAGKIGIGDNNPDRELVVKNGSSNSTIKILASNAHTSQLIFSDTDAELVARLSLFHGSGTSQNDLLFDVGGQTRLAITSSGTVNTGGQLTQTAHQLSVNKSDGNCIVIGNTSGTSPGSHNAQIVASDGTNFNNLKLTGQEVKVFTNVSGGVGVTEVWKFDTDGNLRCSRSGSGISFINAADTATGETVSSSVLDDYEEGSFTPTFDAPNQAGAGFSIFKQHGYYTKIGNIVNVVVYIQGYCSSNSGGGANDDIKVTGLPYTCASIPSGSNIRHTGNWAIGSRYKIECDDLTAYTFGGQTIINLLVPSNGGTGTQLKTNQADQNTCEFLATATYRVA